MPIGIIRYYAGKQPNEVSAKVPMTQFSSNGVAKLFINYAQG